MLDTNAPISYNTRPVVVRWRAAIQAADLKAPAKAVLFILAQYMDADGTGAWPSLQRLANEAGLSKRCVRVQLHKAEQLGLLKRDRATPYSVYTFEAAFPDGGQDLPGAESRSPRGRNRMPPGGEQRSPDLDHPPRPNDPDDPPIAPTASAEPTPATEPPEPPDRDSDPIKTDQEVTPEQVVALFNTLLAEQLQPQRKVAPVRAAIEAILNERPEAERLAWWRRRFQAVGHTSWMTGGMSSRWQASLYWLVKPDSQGRLGIDKIELAPDRAPGAAGRDFTGCGRKPSMLGLPH